MATASKNSFRPTVERLEDRLVPTVTYHGGALLTHVQAENLYLGSAWMTSGGQGMAKSLEGFSATLVNSRYMDLLTWAGYGVGRGTDYVGKVLNYNLNSYVTDGQIKGSIQQAIRGGGVMQPVANNLYVVFVAPGVNVVASDGESSARQNFTGYHSYFVGTNYYGTPTYIQYAVIAYPGHGVNPTPQYYGYPNELAALTDTASHEIGEAATDPRDTGWYDNRYGMSGEVGDLTNSYHQYLGSYYVQLLANKNDSPMFLTNGIYYHGVQTNRVSGLPYDAKPAASGPSIQEIAAAIDYNFGVPDALHRRGF